MSTELAMSRARAKHLSALLAPPHPFDADLSDPAPPQFVPATCPECGRDVLRLVDADEAAAAARFREVLRMRQEGMTQERIGAAVGMATASVCRMLGGKGHRRMGHGSDEAPILVEPEETIAYGVRGPGAGVMRVVRVAHRVVCAGGGA